MSLIYALQIATLIITALATAALAWFAYTSVSQQRRREAQTQRAADAEIAVRASRTGRLLHALEIRLVHPPGSREEVKAVADDLLTIEPVILEIAAQAALASPRSVPAVTEAMAHFNNAAWDLDSLLEAWPTGTAPEVMAEEAADFRDSVAADLRECIEALGSIVGAVFPGSLAEQALAGLPGSETLTPLPNVQVLPSGRIKGIGCPKCGSKTKIERRDPTEYSEGESSVRCWCSNCGWNNLR